MFSIFSYGYATRNTKKIVVLATHGDGEPPKSLDACYVKDIKHHFDNPEKTPFNLIMGDMLDQREYLRDYRLMQKGGGSPGLGGPRASGLCNVDRTDGQ